MQKVRGLRPTIAGRRFRLDPDLVVAAVERVEPEPVRDHFVVVNGRRFPPKQVIGVVTRLDRSDFTTYQARSVLMRLGFTASRLGGERDWDRRAKPESDEVPALRDADELRPHRGRFVALRDNRVVHVADRPEEVLAWLASHHERADSLFRVPLDPSVDLGGFPG